MVPNRFIDMKKFIVILILLFFSIPAMALDWDLKDEDMSDITDWADEDAGSGVSSQATFDGKSCMKLYVPASSSYPGDKASRRITLGNFIDNTFELSFYADEAGGTAWGYLYIAIIDDTDPNEIATLSIYSDKIRWKKTGNVANYADVHIATDCWNRIRILKNSSKVSVWINGLLYDYEHSPKTKAVTDNQIVLYLWGGDGIRTTYIDYMRLDSTAEHLSTSPLSIGTENIVSRYRQNTDNATYPNGVEVLRMYGGTNYGNEEKVLSIPLVATGNANASKVRIYDGSAVKSLMKLP